MKWVSVGTVLVVAVVAAALLCVMYAPEQAPTRVERRKGERVVGETAPTRRSVATVTPVGSASVSTKNGAAEHADELSVVVRVIDRHGRSVSGVSLSAHTLGPSFAPPNGVVRAILAGEPRRSSAQAASGSDGRASFTGLAEGEWIFLVDSDGRGLGRSRIVPLPQSPVPVVVVRLSPDREAHGTVTGADGAPRAGVRVIFALGRNTTHPLSRIGARVVVTGVDGRFRLKSLPSTAVDVLATIGEASPVLVGTLGEQDSLPFDFVFRDEDLGGPASTAPVSVTGRLVDRAGRVAGGVEVFAFVRGSRFPVASTSSSSSGQFAFDSLPPGEYRFGCAPGRGLSGRHGTVLAASWSDDEPIQLVVPAGGVLAGRVIDAAGEPVAGVIVTATHVDRPHQLDHGTSSTASATTELNGTFEVWSLAPGRFEISVSGRDREARDMTLGGPVMATTGTVDLTLSVSQGLSVCGSVTDMQGTPLSGVAVAIVDRKTFETRTTGSRRDGSFRIAGLRADGRYYLKARTGGLPPRTMDVEPGDPNVRVSIDLGERLHGVALLPSGEPFRSGDLGLAPAGSRTFTWTKTGSDGRFSVVGLSSGRHRVVGRVVHTRTRIDRFVAEPVDAGASGIVIRLKPE